MMSENNQNSVEESQELPSLTPAGAAIGAMAYAPRWPVYGACLLAIVAAWWFLSLLAAGQAQFDINSPALNAWFFGWVDANALPDWANRLIALCTATNLAPNEISFEQFGLLVLMWLAMAFAMMMPSAAPLIRTYCEIADTARGRDMVAQSPVVLIAGYIVVWLGASIGFALIGLALSALVGPEGSSLDRPLVGFAAAAALIFAGLYQFSKLKMACLEKCQNPFTTLFGQWTTTPWGVFKLGIKQGLYCLGCCWALMLVMLAVGTMNIVWMVGLTIVTVIEKSGFHERFSHVFGFILLAWGLGLAITSL